MVKETRVVMALMHITEEASGPWLSTTRAADARVGEEFLPSKSQSRKNFPQVNWRKLGKLFQREQERD